jgi:type IV pilus assembly protein PilC
MYIPGASVQSAQMALSAEQRTRVIDVRKLSKADKTVAEYCDIKSWKTSGEKLAMLANFTLLLKSGLPILDVMYLQVRNTPSLKMKAALMDAAQRIQANGAIAPAFEAHTTLFSKAEVAMIKAGEEIGQLDRVFQQMGESQKKAQGIARKLTNALIYPGIILVLTYGLFLLFCFVLLPKLKEVYEQLNAQLPWMTQQLVGASDLLVEKPWAAAVPLMVAAMLWRVKSHKKVQYGLYRLGMLTPFGKGYINKVAMTSIMRTLHLTSTSGIHLSASIEMAQSSSTHPVYAKALGLVLGEIKNGISPSAAFYTYSHMFAEGDRLATIMEVGERTGDVSKPIEQLKTIYEEDLDAAANNLQKLVEPLAVVAVAVVIGFLVFAMYYPIFTLGANFMDSAQGSLGGAK